MVEEACKNLAGVSASQVEIQSGIQFYDGITTGEIQEILIRSASDLIDLDHPNYQYVAARLLLFSLRKNLYGRLHDHPKLIDQVKTCIDLGVYDKELLTLYTEEDDLPSGVKVGDVKSTKENVKAIKYSIVHMKALKALQEAMAKIETLETKVKALEDA